MNIKSQLRAKLSPVLWQTLGFWKRIPVYWRLDRSEALRVARGVEGFSVFVNPKICVRIPESVTAYINWRTHAFEDPLSSEETRDFLTLAHGKTCLIDVGAQTGFMSALFSRSRKGPIHILSAEPDKQVHDVLKRAKELNGGDEVDWSIFYGAISDREGTLSMPISNSLYENQTGRSALGQIIEVPSQTLTGLVDSLSWNPDIIKIDVESFEYEILVSSLQLIESIKPALQLEVHWQLLNKRGMDASEFLNPLSDMGYRGIQKRYRNCSDWNRVGAFESVSRLSLSVT